MGISLIPGARNSIGKAAYLGAIITVFAHPGRRFGQMTEALILALAGTVLGVAWSILGIFLSSLAMTSNPPAAYAIRAVFLLIAAFVHGFLRSQAPRVFIFVLLLIIVSVVILTSVSTTVTRGTATQIIYPIFIAAGVILLINLFVFPEFSASFLGETAIRTLNETACTLRKAGDYFITTDEPRRAQSAGEPINEENGFGSSCRASTSSTHGPNKQKKWMKFRMFAKKFHKKTNIKMEDSSGQNNLIGTSLSGLTTSKGDLRARLASCKAAQRECNFEIAFSVLSPLNMKPISGQAMKRLVANTIAVIGACESKYALIGDVGRGDGDQLNSTRSKIGIEGLEQETDIRSYRQGNAKPSSYALSRDTENLKSSNTGHEGSQNFIASDEFNIIETERDTESANAELLHFLLNRIRTPYTNLSCAVSRTVDVVIACIAYAYVCFLWPKLSRQGTDYI